MSKDLPEGWVWVKLGEIVSPTRPKVSPQAFPDLPFVGLQHIESQTMKLIAQGNASDMRSSCIYFEEGDVLYGKMRPYLNKVWVAEFNGLCSAEFLVFSRTDNLDGHYLGFRLNSADFVKFANQQVSGDRPRVSFKSLASFPLQVAPRFEQERIVARLSELMLRVTTGRKALTRAADRLTNYRKALLDAAVTGKLTAKWRAAHNRERAAELLDRVLATRRSAWEKAERAKLLEKGKSPTKDSWKHRYPEPALPDEKLPQLPADWVWSTLEQLTLAHRPISYGILMPKENISDGVPYVRVKDMKGEELDISTLNRTTPEIAAAYSRSVLKEGDLLLAIRGTYGRVVAVPRELDGANITQDTARLAVSPLLDSSYLLWVLRSEMLQKHFQSVARGIAVQGVNIADVRTTPIPLPPLAEQRQIVRILGKRLSAAEHLSSEIDAKLSRVEEQRQALLSEAFAGKLVSQDPDDEPASALIPLIKMEQQVAIRRAKPKLMNSTNKTRSKTTRRGLLEVLRSHNAPMTPDELFKASGYEREFQANEYRQDVVDEFYEELRQITGPRGAVCEKRPDDETVLLEIKQ
jgi:type I restriction enzyme S subunit